MTTVEASTIEARMAEIDASLAAHHARQVERLSALGITSASVPAEVRVCAPEDNETRALASGWAMSSLRMAIEDIQAHRGQLTFTAHTQIVEALAVLAHAAGYLQEGAR